MNAPEPREIGLCDRDLTGRIGEIVALRGNEVTSGGGRIVRVALDQEALDASAEGMNSRQLKRLVEFHRDGRIDFLPHRTFAVVVGFDVTPGGRSCARLKASLFVRRGRFAWCLMTESGPPITPMGPPIADEFANAEAELRVLRKRHRAFYARASRLEVEVLDRAAVLRTSIEIIAAVLRDHFDPQNRAEQERHAHVAEAAFVACREEVRASMAFRALTDDEREAIDADCFRVDFDVNPIDRDA